MAMGKRTSEHAPMWVAATDLPASPGHPFYVRLNAILDEAGFDRFAEEQCQPFYAPVMGRPSLPPGRYFRLLLVGYSEGLDSERGIAWRAADSLAVRSFVGLGLDTAAPDHSPLSRTRRLIDVETHRASFTWVQERVVAAELLKGRTVALDATTLEANAAMRSIVRRDTGETYQEFLTRLAKASGLKTPTREALARLDRRRKKRTSNQDGKNPFDPDAKITKMTDGRTHLAHKAEHALDLDTGAMVAVTLQGADVGDTTSLIETALAAAEQVDAVHAARPRPAGLTESIADRGYHSHQTLLDLQAGGVRTYIAEPDRGQRHGTTAPRRATGRLRQSAAPPRRARQTAHASPRGVRRTSVRSRVRHRRTAAHAPARASEHPQTPAHPRERVQPRHSHAAGMRARHAARAPRRPLGGVCARHCSRDVWRAALGDDKRGSRARPRPSARVARSFGAGDGMTARDVFTTNC